MTLSFSIVLETENLETAGPQHLLSALGSLAQQTTSPLLAREVVLVNSGRVNASIIKEIGDRFPWVRVHATADPVDYYAAKAIGYGLTSGEVVLFFDSDVQYDSRWLASILDLFAATPELDVVAGETSLEVSGPYTLAVLLTWAFPPWSRRARAYSTRGYAANNVAFRRRALQEIPIPLATGLWRGNCTLHSHQLLQAARPMLRCPGAKAVHPALPFREFYPRMWNGGFRNVAAILLQGRTRTRQGWRTRVYALAYVSTRRSLRLATRSAAVLHSYPRWWALLPLALPIAVSGLLVSLLGAATASIAWRGQAMGGGNGVHDQ